LRRHADLEAGYARSIWWPNALDAIGPVRVLQRIPSFDIIFVGRRS